MWFVTTKHRCILFISERVLGNNYPITVTCASVIVLVLPLCYFLCLEIAFFTVLHTYIIGHYIYSLHIQPGIANLITDASIHRVINYFSLYFVKYSLHWQMFQIKIVELSGIFNLFCIWFFVWLVSL